MNFVFQLSTFDHRFPLHQDSRDFLSAYIKARYPPRNDEGDQSRDGELGLSICNGQGTEYGKTMTRYLDDKEYKAVMKYILLNCDEVELYISFRFHKQERGSGSLTYNCGVRVKGDYHRDFK
ncbi:hypothetical protein M9H77_18104 [Catharanthus roseus]|uniref:Uncharacterized protein n=1 Tax=Catharanthus roseus TaxID=4058 RepID=A0ACC0B6G4_CATRO|nr:hypothetical protein M9H77_18104 [Catharanthus roseus]